MQELLSIYLSLREIAFLSSSIKVLQELSSKWKLKSGDGGDGGGGGGRLEGGVDRERKMKEKAENSVANGKSWTPGISDFWGKENSKKNSH